VRCTVCVNICILGQQLFEKCALLIIGNPQKLFELESWRIFGGTFSKRHFRGFLH
jgi:hypothetical protein